MKKMKSSFILLMLLVLTLVPFSAVSYGEEKLSRDEKILALGTPLSNLLQMTESNKEYVEKIYDRTNGEAEYVLDSSGITAYGSSDIVINAYSSSDGTDSEYKYVRIDFTSNTYAPNTTFYSRAFGLGVAWSDSWSYDTSETVAHWQHPNFWGAAVHEYEWGIIDEYAPKAGITFKMDELNSNCYDPGLNGYVRLKKSKSSTGTTDFSVKFGYSEDKVTWSATVSSTPGISFYPAEKIHQRSKPGSFKY